MKDLEFIDVVAQIRQVFGSKSVIWRVGRGERCARGVGGLKKKHTIDNGYGPFGFHTKVMCIVYLLGSASCSEGTILDHGIGRSGARCPGHVQTLSFPRLPPQMSKEIGGETEVIAAVKSEVKNVPEGDSVDERRIACTVSWFVSDSTSLLSCVR